MQSKDKSDLFEAERIIRQQLELLNQRDLHAAAAHAEAKAAAAEQEHTLRQRLEILIQRYLHAEADRAKAAAIRAALEAVRAVADAVRALVEADRARAESDREVARERLLLLHRQEALNSQRYLAGTPTEKSNLSGHGGDAPPWQNGRHDRVATEGGAHMRGEQKLTYKKAGPFGGGFC